MAIKIVLLTLWIIVSLLEGRRDAFTFHYKKFSIRQDNYDLHWIFTSERSVILGLISGIHLLLNSWYNTAIFSASLALIFSFLHNGYFYATRNFLDSTIYPKKWFDSSTTSTAHIELGPISRTVLALIGLVGIITTAICEV